jgi:hypothetical protein
MRLIHLRRLSLNLLFLSLLAALSPHRSLAATQHLQIYTLEQEDIDHDGSPDLTIISCACVTNSDRIYVYDGGKDMQVGKEWEKVTDFINDTWVFDIGAHGTAQLIIRFIENEGRLEAQFFDDQDGDHKVSYKIDGAKVIINESNSWSYDFVSDGSWFYPDGYPNLNIQLFEKGKKELVSELVDINHDGVPEYEIWNFLSSDSGSVDPKTSHGIWVNEGASKPTVITRNLFWPFLLAGGPPDVQNKFDSIPFVSVDWGIAKLNGTSFGKIQGGYPIEAGYFILSASPLYNGKENYANFENPMAYYDLAGDDDGYPELHIRLEYFDPMDSLLDAGLSEAPFNSIRYSWSQGNPNGLYWSYKVDLAGRNLVTSSVEFKDFAVRTVPYEQLPKWVSDNIWEWGTFVAVEANNTRSAEGIYDWPATNEVWQDRTRPDSEILGSQLELRKYLIGKSENPPDSFYHHIRPGFRGEFGYINNQPFLYLSPVDAKLHLVRAFQGVLNLGNGFEIYYENINHDDYIDKWSYFENGKIRRSLVFAAKHLIYSGENKLVLKKIDVAQSIFETLPPRNHEEWEQIGQKIREHRRDFNSADFQSMVDQFSGPTLEIENASIQDFRLTSGGFRFVLQLQRGFSVTTDPDRIVELIHRAGDYVVSYDGSGFSIAPLTPTALSIAGFHVGTEGEPVWMMKWTALEGQVANGGLEDAHDETVCAWLRGPHAQQQVFTTALDLIPAEGAQGFHWDWLPEEAGTWHADLEVGCDPESKSAGSGRTLASLPIDVQPSSASPGQLLTLGGSIREEVLYLLFSISLFAAGVAAFLLRRGG